MSTPIDTFEAMLAAGQDNEMLRYTLGNAYYANKSYAQAIDHLRMAVTHKPDYSAAWKVLGRALSDDGQLDAALVAFDEGLSAADANGDKQTAKEITVFRRRAAKLLDAPPDDT